MVDALHPPSSSSNPSLHSYDYDAISHAKQQQPQVPHRNGTLHKRSTTSTTNAPSTDARSHPSPSKPLSYYRQNRIPDPQNQTFLGRLIYRPFFTTTQLESLISYQNRGSDLSLIYRYIMSPLYSHLIHYLPKTLPPNTITLLGLLFVLIPHLFLLSYSYNLQNTAPSYVYVLNAIGLFIYMIMDNLDGRQARRTGSSSPLGHLFDHGCDALNVTISGLTMVATLQLGHTDTPTDDHHGGHAMMSLLGYWLVWTMGQFVCYMATLEEFFTGSMILRQINGPNEGIFLIVGLLIMTAILGPDVWNRKFLVPSFVVDLLRLQRDDQGRMSLKLKYWMCLLPIPMVLPTCFLNLYEVWKNGHRQKNRSGWKDLITAGFYSFNFIVFSLAMFSWIYVVPNNFQGKMMLLIWLSGACFFHIVSRLILAHLTGIKFPLFLKMLMPLCFGASNAVFGHFIQGRPFLDDQILFWCVYTSTMMFNAWRIYCMITQICHYLGIRCFSIKKLYDD